jgi:outer membrane immunogenic protein
MTGAIAEPASWTGPYLGGTLGWNWADDNVSLSPNDTSSAGILSGGLGFVGEQPLNSSLNLQQRNGLVGGFEGGYNWQTGSNWLVGVEADINFTTLSGMANTSSLVLNEPPPGFIFSQVFNVQQSTEWYGTVRGRLGWLATPDLLVFGTAGYAYGRVAVSGNYTAIGPPGLAIAGPGFFCTSSSPCFVGSSTSIRSGWTAGGGAELRISQSVTFKVEYQFIDLGNETLQIISLNPNGAPTSSSFNASFRNDIQVVRAGLNFHL